jgi:hypothetical protein
MGRDPFSDDAPPIGKRGSASRGVGSPASRAARFVGAALLGFAVTSAFVWFGPAALDSLRDLSWPSFGVDRKPDRAPRWKSPIRAEFDRAIKAVNSPLPINQSPSIPTIQVGPLIPSPAPNASGGAMPGGYRIRR